MNTFALVAGLVVLASIWLGPLPNAASDSFAAHMTMHMAVVAVGAPLIAVAMAGTAFDPVRAMPRLMAPVAMSLVELVVVWGWHAPALHHAVRRDPLILVLEQASFFAAGFLLWIAAVGGDREHRASREAAGIVALLFTSMHMTLLGALFTLANRPVFARSAEDAPALSDQHLGGAIMLVVGGVSYLAGGLWLTARMLRAKRTAQPARIVAAPQSGATS
jgi:putative membrane protein